MGSTVSICNATNLLINIFLSQVEDLYYEFKVKPNECMTRSVGKVWFTIKAEIWCDDNEVDCLGYQGFSINSHGWYMGSDRTIYICGGPTNVDFVSSNGNLRQNISFAHPSYPIEVRDSSQWNWYMCPPKRVNKATTITNTEIKLTQPQNFSESCFTLKIVGQENPRNLAVRKDDKTCLVYPENVELGPVSVHAIFYLSDPANPIVEYQIGQSGRIEYLKAEVFPSHLDKGVAVTKQVRDWIRMTRNANDDAGHIIAQRLGGPGDVAYNFFPQSRSISRGIWKTEEDLVYNWLQHYPDSSFVRMSFNFVYSDDEMTNTYATRPNFFVYHDEFYLTSGERFSSRTFEVNNAANKTLNKQFG
jgi:hypothetical protein